MFLEFQIPLLLAERTSYFCSGPGSSSVVGETSMNLKKATVAAALAAVIFAPLAARAANVNCNAGGSISRALATGARNITVIGTCVENLIEIRLDDVKITGKPNAR